MVEPTTSSQQLVLKETLGLIGPTDRKSSVIGPPGATTCHSDQRDERRSDHTANVLPVPLNRNLNRKLFCVLCQTGVTLVASNTCFDRCFLEEM